MFRMFVVGMLIAGGMVMVAEAPGGSVPVVSKSCKSLQALDKQLSKVVRSNNYKSSTISSLAKSFRDAGKSAPKSIKSAINTIAATVASMRPPRAASAAPPPRSGRTARSSLQQLPSGGISLDELCAVDFHRIDSTGSGSAAVRKRERHLRRVGRGPYSRPDRSSVRRRNYENYGHRRQWLFVGRRSRARPYRSRITRRSISTPPAIAILKAGATPVRCPEQTTRS